MLGRRHPGIGRRKINAFQSRKKKSFPAGGPAGRPFARGASRRERFFLCDWKTFIFRLPISGQNLSAARHPSKNRTFHIEITVQRRVALSFGGPSESQKWHFAVVGGLCVPLKVFAIDAARDSGSIWRAFCTVWQ